MSNPADPWPARASSSLSFHARNWSNDAIRDQAPSKRQSRRSMDTQHDLSGGSAFKRRRSSEYSWSGFASGMRSTLDSFSKRSRAARYGSASTFVPTALSPPPSPPLSPEPRRFSHARSASRTQSPRDFVDADPAAIGLGIDTIPEDEDRLVALQHPLPVISAAAGPLDLEPRSRTPLLPQFADSPEPERQVQSPLQSPSVAATPSLPPPSCAEPSIKALGLMTPPLSEQPSLASFRRAGAHANAASSTAEIPHMIVAESDDSWTELLGHANFTILPQPYLPDHCDTDVCARMLADWQAARAEYLKHRSATERHFGASSRIYQWTEAKWSSIDAQWRDFRDLALCRAVENGDPVAASPAEPAPLPTMPIIDDPRIALGQDIVGPMEVVQPPYDVHAGNPHAPSRKEQLWNLLIPSARLRRSLSASRPL